MLTREEIEKQRNKELEDQCKSLEEKYEIYGRYEEMLREHDAMNDVTDGGDENIGQYDAGGEA